MNPSPNVVNFQNAGPLVPGGGPPHDGGMEARLAKVEATVTHVQSDVTMLRDEKLGERLAGIKERLNHMPTKLQMWVAVIVTIAGVVSTTGSVLWWIAQQFLTPILAKMVGS